MPAATVKGKQTLGLGPKVMKTAPVQQQLSLEAPPSPLSSRPKRTRISYFALLATSTYAVFLKKTARC
jgi:hypothetical protein